MLFTHICFSASHHILILRKEARDLLKNSSPRGTGSTPQASLLKSLLMQLNCTSAAENRAEDKTQQGWQDSHLSQKRRNPIGGEENRLRRKRQSNVTNKEALSSSSLFSSLGAVFQTRGLFVPTHHR